MLDLIIIGGGMAGMTACLYSLRNNKTTLILERESVGGQISKSPKVENYPTAKSMSGMDLSSLLFDQILELGAGFEVEDVVGIEKIDNVFHVKTNYNVYQSKAVIIATGAKHRELGLEGEEKFIGKGVFYCAICDGPFFKGQEVSLIGDGNSALQYALMLSEYCSKVNIFTLFNKFFGEKTLIDKVLNKENIKIYHNLKAVELKGQENLEAVVFENKEGQRATFSTKALFVAIGQVPDNKVFKDLVDLNKQGYIIADETCETKTPGLYVAGDCRTKDVRQVATAVGDGAVAATKAYKYLSTLEE